MRKNIKGLALVFLMFLNTSNNAFAISNDIKLYEESKQTSTINATVPPTKSTYTVNIPESIYMGSLSAENDMNYKYNVILSMGDEKGTVTISSDEKTDLVLENKSNNLLPCYNFFGKYSLSKDTILEGNILIKKEDIANAAQGRYIGSLNFYIKYDPNVSVTPNPPTYPTPSPSTFPTPTPSPSPTITPLPQLPIVNEGNYICDVSMRKDNNFYEESMCNKLFYKKADISYKGNTATLTLYVVDPIPNYVSEGTPLSNVNFIYNSSTYNARVNTSNKVAKYFDAASGFITTSGNYYASPIVVNLPIKALEESVNGGLTCNSYINAIMNTTQSFYVVLSNFEKGQTPQENNVTSIAKPKSKKTKPTTKKSQNDLLNKSNNTSTKHEAQSQTVNNTTFKPIGYILKTESLWKMVGFILFTIVISSGYAAYSWFKKLK